MLTGLFTTQSAYAATISLSVSGSITTTALPTSASGTTAVSDTNTTNISITTDNTTGYTLSLKSSSETAPALTGATNNSNTIPSISTETATLDNFASGTWGYKPTKKVSGVWTNLTVIHGDTDYTSGYYLPGPTTTADVIDVTDAANSTANEYNIALGTKVSTNTAIDSYTGTFVVTAVANKLLYLQDVADWEDTEIPNTGDTVTAVDKRDNEGYLVGRLADGRVWLLDNLRLGSTSTTALTSANTNIASNYTLPASTTTGFDSSTGYTTAAINTASKDKTTTSYGSGSGKIGTYYNYCAASAGTICSSSNSSNASYDICPKGWRMPTGGSSGEYNTLYTAYGSDASSFRSALSTPLSGGFYDGSAFNQGSLGLFWSSTRYGNTYMCNLYVNSSNVLPTNVNNRYNGISMRCVAKKPSKTVTISENNSSYGSVSSASVSVEEGSAISTSSNTITIGSTTVTATASSGYAFDSWTNNCGSTLTANCSITANFKGLKPYMQDFSCSSLASGATTTLYDSRDGEAYLVGKLADGKCWLLDNLRLGSTSTITLTPANTNIASNYTLPASTTTGFTNTSTGYTTAAINTASKDKTTTSYGSGSGKIGTYYNYCAASAGTICSSSNSSNASYDICPKGWRMPTGGSSGEYNTLYTAYGSDASSFRSALSTPLSGRFVDGSAFYQGSSGYFWSSTRSSSTGMYLLYVSSSSVYPSYGSYRYYGYSMRCVSQ